MASVPMTKEELGDMEDVCMDEEEETIHYAEINYDATKSDDNHSTTTPEEEDDDEGGTVTVPKASPAENDWMDDSIAGLEKANKEARNRRRMLAFVVVLAWMSVMSLAIALPLVLMNNKAEHNLNELPTEKTMVDNDCNMDVKECNDGSFVGRNQTNNCEFLDCPVDDADIITRSGSMDGPWFVVPPEATDGCPHELDICQDGTLVNRSGPDCAFQPCPIPGEGATTSGSDITMDTTTSKGTEGCAEGFLSRCFCSGTQDFGNSICDVTKSFTRTALNTEAECEAFCQSECGAGSGSSFSCHHMDAQASTMECASSCECATLDGGCPVHVKMPPFMPFGEQCTAFCRRADVCGPEAVSTSTCGVGKPTSGSSNAFGTGTSFYKMIMATMLAVVVAATM